MKDDFGKYKVRITPATAIRLLQLISDHADFDELNIGDVLDLNMLVDQLEEIISKEIENV